MMNEFVTNIEQSGIGQSKRERKSESSSCPRFCVSFSHIYPFWRCATSCCGLSNENFIGVFAFFSPSRTIVVVHVLASVQFEISIVKGTISLGEERS